VPRVKEQETQPSAGEESQPDRLAAIPLPSAPANIVAQVAAPTPPPPPIARP